MHNIDLILTLTAGLAAALVLGYLTYLLRLSPIVGYLLAGLAVGGHTPGYRADQNIAEQFAEIGVILLMFEVGLHFHVQDLLAVRRIAIPGAIVQSIVATILGMLVALAFGWTVSSGIVFGLCLAVASTVVLTRVLIDNRELHTPTGHVAIGWLIVEDLFTVLVLVVLPAIAGGSETSLGPAIAFAAFKVAALAILTVVLGARVIPWIFVRAARTSARELFTLTVLVIVLGIAVGSAKLFDVSMALGAFLAGMVVGRSEFSLRAASEALPIKDAFAVLFFVSVGMLLDPHVLIEHPGLILASILVVTIGKALAAFGIVLFLGYPLRTALGVSVALAQIGEFSFILAGLGRQLGLLDDVALHCLVATSIVTISLNPLFYRLIGPINNWIESRPDLARRLTSRLRKQLDSVPRAEEDSKIPRGPRAVIVGYGPTGQTVEKLLLANGITPTIVELNVDTARRLKEEGKHVVFGDACRLGTLESADIAKASSLILTSSSIDSPGEVIEQAKRLNPSIRIVARTSYVRELKTLRETGCDEVFSGEGEVALALIEEILRDLGATSAQIARERRRAYEEFFKG